ncbi:MAG TPA: CNNM domain-containing protein, partial [Pengzhenrongella sp.]
MLTQWFLVGLGILLTFGTAVFVSSEFSLIAVDPGLVDKATRPDDRRGQSVIKALRHLSTELSGAQVGITVTTILLGYTTQPAVDRLLRSWFEQSPLSRTAGAVLAAV